MTSTRPPKQAAAQPAAARPRDPSAMAAHGPVAHEPQPFGNQAALRTLDSGGEPVSPGHWAAAQSLLGNQGVLRRLQTKLAINQPGDQYEQEADQVAHQVLQMSGGCARRQLFEV